MSSLSYRTWDVWINTGLFNPAGVYDGYYECSILGTLMVPQSIGFLAENYEIRKNQVINVVMPPPEIIRQVTTTEEGQLCVRIYGDLDTTSPPLYVIQEIQCLLDSLSISIDSPLTCSKIRFISHHHGKLLVANRRSIGRGYAFEVDERGTAGTKIQQDLQFYRDTTDPHLVVGRRHYMTGMQLLSLEDQITGLIDAAFMQFYQGCESLCRDPSGRIEGSKKFIASQGMTDSRELQIVAHQVWRVRNEYFGHGDVKSNLYSNLNKMHAESVARQVLVARYLCKRLIDLNCPSNTFLAREMGIFFGAYSGKFNGQVAELESTFRVNFNRRTSDVFDTKGVVIEQYQIR